MTEEKLAWYQTSTFFVYKNLLVVSLAAFCNFFAFTSTQNLQSSLNAERGFISLCVLYTFYAVCLLFLPKLLVACIGYKFSISLAIFGYTIYQMIQFHPTTGMMIFGAICVGFSASVFWVAVPSTITILARQYSQHTGKLFEATNQKFYAIYYFIFRFALVPSNILLSAILKEDGSKAHFYTNSTISPTNLQCGIKACPKSLLNPSLIHMNIKKDVQRLFWIYLEVGLSGVAIILLFLSNIKETAAKNVNDDSTENVWMVVKKNLFAVLKIFREIWILELFIISMAQGMVQSFMIGDMTKNFATCAFGINYIGYVIMCSGLGNCLAALIIHTFVEKIGIFVIIMVSWLSASTIMIWFFFWNVAASPSYVLLITNILFGMAEGALTSQVHGYYGVIFYDRKAAAFATFSIARSVGNTISFAYGNSLCVMTKVIILLLLNFVGICLFCHVYYDNQKLKKKQVMESLQPT